jgi:hypothetical protein
MFLVVFTTLMISIIGLYAQVLSVQSGRIFANQTGLMQTMQTWHAAAVKTGYADTTVLGTTAGHNYCVLTASSSLTPKCATAVVTVALGCSTTLATAGACLPTGYNTITYSFASILFVTTTAPFTKYVVTYVSDKDANGFLQLPDSNGTTIGFSPATLSGQFKHAAPKDLLYGGVTATADPTINTFNVWIPGNNGVTTLTYALPAAVPAGAFALISAAQ